MASANKTPNLNLPQWVGTEKPERTDFNAAFSDLDQAIKDVLDSVNNLKVKAYMINASSSTTVTFGGGGLFMIVVRVNQLSPSVGAYIAHTYAISVDRWSVVTLADATQITITKGSNTLTINNSNSNAEASAVVISFNGSALS